MKESLIDKNVTLRANQDTYIPNKYWYAWCDPRTKYIVCTVGTVFPLDDPKINNNENLEIFELGRINEPTWKMLKKISNRPYYAGFLDYEEDEINYFKLSTTPTCDADRDENKIYSSVNNQLTFSAQVYDEYGNVANIDNQIQVKKISGRSNSKIGNYTINDSKSREVTIDNGGEFNINILEKSQFSIKVTAKLTSGIKLNRYITFKHNEYNTNNN
jgi:hypothetical protein